MIGKQGRSTQFPDTLCRREAHCIDFEGRDQSTHPRFWLKARFTTWETTKSLIGQEGPWVESFCPPNGPWEILEKLSVYKMVLLKLDTDWGPRLNRPRRDCKYICGYR